MNSSRKIIKAGLFAMVAGSIVSFGAQAECASSQGPVPFNDFDKDGNGFVTEEEFYTTRGQHMAAKAAEGKQLRGAASAPAFADIDTNSDGQLSPEEMASAHKAHMGKHRGMGKGPHEAKGQGNAMKGNMPTFSDFDLDGDGKIVESEFNQAHASRMSEMAAKGHQMKHAGDAPGFSGIDSNDDGEISEQEFAEHQAEHHQKMQKGNKHSD